MRIRKITAAIIVGITLLAICLSMTSCSQIQQQENTDLILYGENYNRLTTSAPGLGIINHCNWDDTTMETACLKGCIVFQDEYDYVSGKESRQNAIWWHSATNYSADDKDHCLEDYLSFIIRADSHIIGYGVLHITTTDKITYHTKLVASFEFPKINSRYQNISEEYVHKQINNYIALSES